MSVGRCVLEKCNSNSNSISQKHATGSVNHCRVVFTWVEECNVSNAPCCLALIGSTAGQQAASNKHILRHPVWDNTIVIGSLSRCPAACVRFD
jgi:hypothetical protein